VEERKEKGSIYSAFIMGEEELIKEKKPIIHISTLHVISKIIHTHTHIHTNTVVAKSDVWTGGDICFVFCDPTSLIRRSKYEENIYIF